MANSNSCMNILCLPGHVKKQINRRRKKRANYELMHGDTHTCISPLKIVYMQVLVSQVIQIVKKIHWLSADKTVRVTLKEKKNLTCRTWKVYKNLFSHALHRKWQTCVRWDWHVTVKIHNKHVSSQRRIFFFNHRYMSWIQSVSWKQV